MRVSVAVQPLRRSIHTSSIAQAQQKQGGKFRQTAAASQAAARAKRQQQQTTRQHKSQQKRSNAGNQVEGADKSVGLTPGWTSLKQSVPSARDLPTFSSIVSASSSSSSSTSVNGKPRAVYMPKKEISTALHAPLLEAANLKQWQQFAMDDLPLVFRPSLYAALQKQAGGFTLLTGPPKSGKSVTLLVMLERARQDGDILLYIDANDLCGGRYPFDAAATSSEGLYQQAELAQHLLRTLHTHFAPRFKEVRVSKDISIGQRTFKAEESTLLQLLEAGAQDVTAASSVWTHLLQEITKEKTLSMSIFIENANLLLQKTRYLSREGKAIEPNQLLLVRSLHAIWQNKTQDHIKTLGAVSTHDTTKTVVDVAAALERSGLSEVTSVQNVPAMDLAELSVYYQLLSKQKMMGVALDAAEEETPEEEPRITSRATQKKLNGSGKEPEQKKQEKRATTKAPLPMEAMLAKQTAWSGARPSTTDAIYQLFR